MTKSAPPVPSAAPPQPVPKVQLAWLTARSERSILARLVELQKGVQTCYERNKRRKRDLAGSIKLYWTILANGTVDRISIEGTWNDAALGSRIETCIKRKVETWQFEEIAASAGDFPTGTRFIFE